jgi:hypothetical protein
VLSSNENIFLICPELLFICTLYSFYAIKFLLLKLPKNPIFLGGGGNHLVVIITKQTTVIQSNTAQVYFNSVCYFNMFATCFSLYLCNPQACPYVNLTKNLYKVFYCIFFNLNFNKALSFSICKVPCIFEM